MDLSLIPRYFLVHIDHCLEKLEVKHLCIPVSRAGVIPDQYHCSGGAFRAYHIIDTMRKDDGCGNHGVLNCTPGAVLRISYILSHVLLTINILHKKQTRYNTKDSKQPRARVTALVY